MSAPSNPAERKPHREVPGFQARMSSIPPQARASPAAPPIVASRTLSASNCRANRPRPAPRLRRRAISRSQTVARARTRFATLTTAISSTSPTAPHKTRIAGRSVVPRSRRAGEPPAA